MFLFPKTVYKINAIQIEVIVSRNKISSDCNYGPEGTANNVLQLSSIALEIKWFALIKDRVKRSGDIVYISHNAHTIVHTNPYQNAINIIAR